MSDFTFKKFLIETIDLPYDEWVKELREVNYVGETLVKSLEGLYQGVKYHPELTVLKHTWLVIQSLKERDAENLYEAGLFHDVGKIYTTHFHRNGNVTSYGHARKAKEFFHQYFVKEYIDMGDFKHHTGWIIERHMDFDVGHKRFKQKNQYDEPYDLLETFVWADKERSRKMFFDLYGVKEVAKNMDLLERAMDKKFNTSRGLSDATLYLNIGISGSGKSTMLNKIINNLDGYFNYTKDLKIVSPDEIRKELLGYVGFDKEVEPEVWDLAHQRVISALFKGNNVVLDATNVNRYTRVKFLSYINYLMKGRKIYTIGLLYEPIEPSVARERIQKDLDKGIDRSDVPIEVINKQHKNLKESIQEGFTDLHEIKFMCS